MIHPELDRLQQRYTEIIDEYDAGNLPYEDAVNTIAAMTVVDGGGFVWSINTATGSFCRAMPGEEPVDADHSAFVAAQLPDPNRAPWTPQDLTSPPDVAHQGHMGQHAVVANAQSGPATPLPPQSSKNRPRSLSDAEGGSFMDRILPAGSGAAEFFEENKRTVLIAGGCLLLLFAFLVLRPSGDDTAVPGADQTVGQGFDDLTSTTVVSDAAAGPDVTVAPDATTAPDVTAAPDPAPTSTVPAPTVPTVEAQAAVVVELVSADRGRVAAVTGATDANVIAMRTGEFAGYANTGLTMSFGPAAINGDGAIVSTATLTNPAADGAVVGTANVTWVANDDGTFRLASLFQFTPAAS